MPVGVIDRLSKGMISLVKVHPEKPKQLLLDCALLSFSNRARIGTWLEEYATSDLMDLQEAYGPVGEAEWNIVTAAELEEKMPALYEMIERTVATIMVAPSLDTLQEIGPTRAEEREARD